MSIAAQCDYATVGLSCNEEGPVFDKPQQAKAFSLIVHLHRVGLFPWAEWVRTFGEAIKAAPVQSGESVDDAYYRRQVTVVENMITALHLTTPDDIARRTQEWRLAYINMPHGQLIVLANASCPPVHSHRSLSLGIPVTVSLAQSSIGQINNGVMS